jgi:(p)ppGpp synthase/HD superfamily hydrolase
MALSERFYEALQYAARLHAEQLRKATHVPYVSHLLAVASLVLEHGGDEDEVIAALLHDAVDQGGAETAAEISRRFGPRVAEIVEGCTDTDRRPKPPWRPRKEAHLAKIRLASPSVRLVVAADKLHNARSIALEYRRSGETVWARFSGGRDGTLWYYRSALDALGGAEASALTGELSRAIAEIERLIGA